MLELQVLQALLEGWRDVLGLPVACLFLFDVLAQSPAPKAPGRWSLTKEQVAQIIASPSTESPGMEYMLGFWQLPEVRVSLSTPYFRVALEVKKAKERYETVALDEAMKLAGPNLLILASPVLPDKITGSFVNVDHLVIIGPSGPVQPTSKKVIPQSASNAFGASVTARGLLATFPIDVLAAGNQLHVILDQKVKVRDATGLKTFEGTTDREAKDIGLPITEEFLAALR